MLSIKIQFARPWLLFIFLAGLAITLILYFTLSKKYRRTRNRITSMVLHLVVFALAVATLAGMLIVYDVPNKENEIILLVDVSDTEQQAASQRDDFIDTVLRQGRYDNYRIGIVTFGYDQVYAVPLTDQVDTIMQTYQSAELPDVSATDIAAALTYTSTLFTHTESAKIVLVTDGKETDENASSVIRSIAAQGIKVDIANIASEYRGETLQLIEVQLPEYHVRPGEEQTISVTIDSKSEAGATLELYDNGELVEGQSVSVASGSQNISFLHTFADYGLHEICFKIRSGDDLLEQNNVYYSYLYLEHLNKILVVEQESGASNELANLLAGSAEAYEITRLNIKEDDDIPTSLNQLREYDQIILNNIANEDMPAEFVESLYRYVNECGGGLFTVGGSNPDGSAHAFDRDDMLNTLYQQMLPVQAIDYTPPVAVIFIIDRSGSMGASSTGGSSKLDWACSGAASCLNALTERDYVGLMTLDSNYDTILPLTPRTQEKKIINAIESIRDLGPTGGTVFTDAIRRACLALRGVDVAKRHIVLVTDGQPGDKPTDYEPVIRDFYETDSISFSVVGIGMETGSSAANAMQRICDIAGGSEAGSQLHAISNDSNALIREMREDLNAPEIKDVNYETFQPIAKNAMSPLLNGVELEIDEEGRFLSRMTATLDGFYGVKARNAAEVILVGDYEVPIYAQWKFGLGTVGCFMCDLKGDWSGDFLADINGQTFLLNVVANLMPVENIRQKEISVSITQDNYTNSANIFTFLQEGQYIEGQITNMTTGEYLPVSMNAVTEAPEGMPLTSLSCYVTSPLSAANHYSRCSYVLKDGGIYKIELFLKHTDNPNEAIATFETFQTVSYSEEYDFRAVPTDDELQTNLATLASSGKGKIIEDLNYPAEIFATFVTSFQKIFDPRYLFMILAIVLFLLDIAVRKFKFKWPHELIREYREKHKK